MNNPSARIHLAAIIAGFVAVTATPALAQGTIYTTFGNGLTFGTNYLQFDSTGITGRAELFTSPITATVGAASLALQAADPGTTLTLAIRATSFIPGNGPGTLVGHFNSAALSTTPGIATFTASSAFQLDAGVQYWLCATAPTGQVNWFHNDQGIIRPTAFLFGGTWDLDQVSSGGLALSIDAVPEPASFALAALGFLAVRRTRVGAAG